MAETPVIISIGSSNMAGFGAALNDVSLADGARWFGYAPSQLLTYPRTASMAGVRIWTPRLPYATVETYTITAVPTTSQVTVSVYTFVAGDEGRWVFVSSNATGQGNVRRITSAGGSATATVNAVWASTLTAAGSLTIIRDSHTVLSVDSTSTVIRKTGTTPALNFGGADLTGKFVVFFASYGSSGSAIFSQSRKITSHTAETMTLEYALGLPGATLAPFDNTDNVAGATITSVAHGLSNGTRITVAAASGILNTGVGYAAGTDLYIINKMNDTFEVSATFGGAAIVLTDQLGTTTVTWYALGYSGFVILTGTGANQSLATQATGAALRTLAVHMDTAPVYLTGYDYNNWDATPFGSPLAALGTFGTRAVTTFPPAVANTNPTINSVPELAWQFRSRFDTPIVMLELGISSSMISPLIIDALVGSNYTGWAHDITQLDFHPSSDNGLYEALVMRIDSLRTLIEAEGNTMSVKAICINLFDNDAADPRYLRIGANAVLLRDALRTYIGDQTIPWIMAGPSVYGGALQPAIYAQLAQVEFEDPYSAYFDTRLTYGLHTDGVHYSAAGQIQLGRDFFTAWLRIADQADNSAVSTDVDICNIALSNIGDSAKVTALDGTDTSAQARHCIRYYPVAVREMLEMHSWDFATLRIELVEVTNTREDEWTYAYAAPTGMVGAIAVLAAGSSRDAPPQPYIIETDAGGTLVLYTDVEGAVIRYNRNAKNPCMFSALFVDALGWLLASKLAGPIIKGDQGKKEAKDCLSMMQQVLGRASTHDSNQRKVEPETDAPWI
jgi:hypothetical protein